MNSRRDAVTIYERLVIVIYNSFKSILSPRHIGCRVAVHLLQGRVVLVVELTQLVFVRCQRVCWLRLNARARSGRRTAVAELRALRITAV